MIIHLLGGSLSDFIDLLSQLGIKVMPWRRALCLFPALVVEPKGGSQQRGPRSCKLQVSGMLVSEGDEIAAEVDPAEGDLDSEFSQGSDVLGPVCKQVDSLSCGFCLGDARAEEDQQIIRILPGCEEEDDRAECLDLPQGPVFAGQFIPAMVIFLDGVSLILFQIKESEICASLRSRSLSARRLLGI